MPPGNRTRTGTRGLYRHCFGSAAAAGGRVRRTVAMRARSRHPRRQSCRCPDGGLSTARVDGRRAEWDGKAGRSRPLDPAVACRQSRRPRPARRARGRGGGRRASNPDCGTVRATLRNAAGARRLHPVWRSSQAPAGIRPCAAPRRRAAGVSTKSGLASTSAVTSTTPADQPAAGIVSQALPGSRAPYPVNRASKCVPCARRSARYSSTRPAPLVVLRITSMVTPGEDAKTGGSRSPASPGRVAGSIDTRSRPRRLVNKLQ